MSRYGRGWKPSPANAPRRFGAGVRFASGELPPSHALAVPSGFPLDQKQTSACVAHSAAACLRILTGLPLASRLELYGVARVVDGEPIASLTDDGCVPSDMVTALAKYGACLESDWPFDPSKVNDPPPWNALRLASAYRVTGWERLPDDASRIDALKRALVAGHPVMFGMPVDEAYESLDASRVYGGLSGPELGGHMQTIVAYDDAKRAARVLGSWGSSFADGGYTWISYDWLLDPRCSDFYALDAVPAGTMS